MDAGTKFIYNLDIKKLHRIHVNVHHMMVDRGYAPASPVKSVDEFESKYIGLLAELEDETNDMNIFGMVDEFTTFFTKDKMKMMVYFYLFDTSVDQKYMAHILKMLKQHKCQQFIIIYNNTVTHKVRSVVENFGNNAQLFKKDELMFNVTKHQLVPEHIKLDPDEKNSVLDKYTKSPDGELHPELVPGIYVNDPVVRYYNFNIGDILKINRPRPDGNHDITYRIVIKDV